MNALPRDAVERAVAQVAGHTETTSRGSSGRGRPPVNEVVRIRDRHHQMARFVAMDVDRERICKIMGMTRSRLDLLIDQTPAFQELIVYYKGRNLPEKFAQTEEYIDILERNMIAAELELADRLAESPEKLSVSELHKVGRDAADRLGYSKQSINLQVNVTLKERLEGLRRRSRGAPVGAGDDGKGVVVLRDEFLGSRPATPLLELRAEPKAKAEKAATSQPPTTSSTPLPSQPPDPDAPMSREAVLARHREALTRRTAFPRAVPAPNQEPIKRRL